MKSPRLPFATAPVGPRPTETALSGEVLRIVFTNPDNGWGVLTVEGCPLGGFKAVDGTLKNHYPKGLRI